MIKVQKEQKQVFQILVIESGPAIDTEAVTVNQDQAEGADKPDVDDPKYEECK